MSAAPAPTREDWEKLESQNNNRYYYYPLPDRAAIVAQETYKISFPTGRTLWYYQRDSKRDIVDIKLERIAEGEAIDRFKKYYKVLVIFCHDLLYFKNAFI